MPSRELPKVAGMRRHAANARKEPQRTPIWSSSMNTLLGAVAGGLLTFIGTWQANQHQDSVSAHSQAESQRATAYTNFETAANAYAVAVASVESQMAACHGKCAVDAASFDKSRGDFQVQINAVYTYGSDAAVTVSRRVAGSLPPSLWSTAPFTWQFDQAQFTQAYQAFLSVACRELPAEPRTNC